MSEEHCKNSSFLIVFSSKDRTSLLTFAIIKLQNQVPDEEFPTTNEDLAGFWDMVMLQVVQVNDLFDQIEKLRKSQWQEVRRNIFYVNCIFHNKINFY